MGVSLGETNRGPTHPYSFSCRGDAHTLVVLCHALGVAPNWEWPTLPRVDGETEL